MINSFEGKRIKPTPFISKFTIRHSKYSSKWNSFSVMKESVSLREEKRTFSCPTVFSVLICGNAQIFSYHQIIIRWMYSWNTMKHIIHCTVCVIVLFLHYMRKSHELKWWPFFFRVISFLFTTLDAFLRCLAVGPADCVIICHDLRYPMNLIHYKKQQSKY